MSIDLKKKTFTGFLWLLAGSSSQTALQILVLSVLARLVAPEDFGIISIAIIFLGFSKIFSQLGMGAAIVQRSTINNKHIRTAYTTSLIIGVFFCLLTFLFSKNVANYFNMPELQRVLKYISCIFIIDSFISVSQSLLQRNLKMKFFALSDLVSYLIGFGIIGVWLAFLEYGLYALVYAYIVQAFTRAIFVSILEPHSIIPYFDKKSFKELFFFGSGHTVAKIANYFAGQGDNLVIGKTLSADALGYYSRAYQLMVAPVRLIGQSLNIVLFPALSSIQTDKEKVKKAYFKSTQLVAYASLLISTILFINAKEIVLILLGEKWVEVILPFQILAVGTLFRMSYKISDSLIKAMGDVHKRAVIQIIYASSVFLFSYIGHYWGIKGVALGVFFAIFLNFVFMTHLSLLQFKETWANFIKIHIKPFILSIFVFVFSYFVLFGLRLLHLNILVTEVLYLFSVFCFTIVIILRFKAALGISNEINAVINKIRK